MKIKRFLLTMAIFAMSLTTYVMYGQIETAQDTTRNVANQEMRQQQEKDKARLNDASDAKKQTKADAKETQRINKDAMDASRESTKAYRAEKKAQKARKNSTNQAKKAEDARLKSDQN